MTDFPFKEEGAYLAALQEFPDEPAELRRVRRDLLYPGSFLIFWDLGAYASMNNLRVAQNRVGALVRAVVRYEVAATRFEPQPGGSERVVTPIGSRRSVADADAALVVQSAGFTNPWWENLQVLVAGGGVGAATFAAMRGTKYLLGLIAEVATLSSTIRARRQDLATKIAVGSRDQMRALVEQARLYEELAAAPRQLDVGTSGEDEDPVDDDSATATDQSLAPTDSLDEQTRAALRLSRDARRVLDAAAQIKPLTGRETPRMEYIPPGDEDFADLVYSLAAYAKQLIEDPRYSTQLDRRVRPHGPDRPLQ